MKRRFKFLALFIFILMLGGWYFSSDTDIIPPTYPNIAFQSKESEPSRSHNVQKQSWNLDGVFVEAPTSGERNVSSGSYSNHSYILNRTNLNYTIIGNISPKNNTRSFAYINGGSNAHYGRSSVNRNLAYDNVPSINFRLPVMRGYNGSVDVDKLFSSDVVQTGQRFGAAQQCPNNNGGPHIPVGDGSGGYKCEKCGQVLTPTSGGADGIIDWVVPIDNPLITLILFSLFYISILYLKRNL